MSARVPIDRAKIPSLPGNKAAARYVRDVLGMPMTERYIKQAIHDGELKPRKFRNINHYSPAMLVAWVTGEDVDTEQNATARR